MELQRMFLPQFRIISSHSITRLRVLRDSSSSFPSFRECFPVSYKNWKALEDHCNDISRSAQNSSSNDDFDQSQVSDHGVQKQAFGQFVARVSMLDEEYWTAAWLRAEAHWESVSYMRHVDCYKRKYAEQEFYAIKRRCAGRDGNSLKCFCIVAAKKEEKDVRLTVANSVVGTLDLSIRQFLQGETFPGELIKYSPVLASHEAYGGHKYAYISNLCVSKFFRRQGNASNMLHLATDLANASDMKQLFVHVNADNMAAQELYRKTGFEMLETASAALSTDQRLLMCMQL